MADFLEISEGELDLEKITGLVSSPDCGAISVFIGTTRDNLHGKKLLNLNMKHMNQWLSKK